MSVVFVRTILIYFLVVLALRIMGKRQLGELQPSELVVTILVSNLATMSIEDSNIPLLGTILPIFTIVGCEVLMSFVTMKSGRAQKLISGNPRILIRDGVIDQREMKNLRWTIEDLAEQLRVGGIFDFAEVSFAIVETSGALSVYPKLRSRPLTLDLDDDRDGEEAPPMILISDGKVVDDVLHYCGVDHKWLRDTLGRKHLELRDVFLMTCDQKQNYKIVEKERKK